MISAARHRMLRSREDAYERAREKFDPKRFRRGGGYTPLDVRDILKIAGLKRSPTNRERSQIEVYEFLTKKPERVFVYADKDLTAVKTWMGDKLGAIVRKSSPYRSLMGDTRVNIRVLGGSGAIYSGTCYVSAGDYCRLKRIRVV